MQEWLQDFAFRITPSPIVFLCVGLGTLSIAILITSYHAIKASMRNPIEVLKDE
jgi:putative ABC transport system permease protein